VEDPESKYSADYHCVQAWLKLNPNWDIRILDKAEAMKLAPKYAILANDTTGRINKVKASNVLLLELLTLYGSVWSDTSNCPFRPLDNFVPSMPKRPIFSAFTLTWAGRVTSVAMIWSNFMIVIPGSLLLKQNPMTIGSWPHRSRTTSSWKSGSMPSMNAW